MGLKRRCPDLKRPYKVPYGVLGCYVTIVLCLFMLFFADTIALYTAGILSVFFRNISDTYALIGGVSVSFILARRTLYVRLFLKENFWGAFLKGTLSLFGCKVSK